MPESNVVICKTPRNDGLSNMLTGFADNYRSGEFYMDFNKIDTVDEIIERLEWMEARGYHLKNDLGRVYRSSTIAGVLRQFYDLTMESKVVYGQQARYLTRSGNLRPRVIELLEHELDEYSETILNEDTEYPANRGA